MELRIGAGAGPNSITMLADGGNHNGHRELENSSLCWRTLLLREEKEKNSPARFRLFPHLENHASQTRRDSQFAIPLAVHEEIRLCAESTTDG